MHLRLRHRPNKAQNASQKSPEPKINHSHLIALAVFSLGLLASTLIALTENQLARRKEEQLAIESVSRVRASMEEAFYRRFSLVSALEALVTSNRSAQDLENEFDDFTASLQREVSGILSLQLAPSGIVSYISNYDRNAAADGHDLLVDDQRREQVLETIQQRSIVVAGPLDLIQGGEAIIARKAIFLDGQAIFNPASIYASNRAERSATWPQQIPADFWGFATVLISTESLYEEAGLNQLPPDYNYAIRGRHGLGASGDVFWGDPEVFNHPLATVSLSLPGGQWIIAIQARSNQTIYRSLGIGLAGIIISSLVAGLVYYNSEGRQKYKLSVLALETERELNALKNRFITTASHEFRTPLGVISSSAGILQDYGMRLDDAKRKKHLQRIQIAVAHMTRLIEDVLMLGQIEAQKVQVKLAPVSVSELCQAIIDELNVSFGSSRIRLEIDPESSDRRMADKQLWRQILINLLTNALKYSPPDSPVFLRLTCQADRCIFVVQDQGMGIPAQDRPYLFKPFHRAKNAENISGTGIGLSIVKKLIEVQQGTITCESEIGVGTKFTVELPSDPV